MLAWAVDQELIVLNPWRDLKKLPAKQRICNANLDHFKTIIEQSPEWLQWAFYTAYACSLRFGIVELFNLRWDAFNWRQGYVQLHQGKSGKLKRVFPPQEYMHTAWHRYQEDMASGIVFVCHRAGKRVLSYKEAWKQAVKRAGLEHMGLHPYDIRHVAATEMLANGADLAAVSAQLGHSSVVTTGTFYAHVTAGSQQRASQKLTPLAADTQVIPKMITYKKNDKG